MAAAGTSSSPAGATAPTTAVIYSLELQSGDGGAPLRHSIVSIPASTGTAAADTADVDTADVDTAAADTAAADTAASVSATTAATATAGGSAFAISFYNIAMFDVSASMGYVWPFVMTGWNDHVAPILTGKTDIYTFGAEVKHRRTATHLEDDDNDSSMTNLTEALAVINKRVHACTQSHVRIFLVTDGCHNSSNIDPSTEIEKMVIPAGKTIEVYLLGVGGNFPVQYSVDIRSLFHNGSASCPTLFWSKETDEEDVLSEMEHIQEEVRKGLLKAKLSIPARVVPYVDEKKTICSSGEYLYYDVDPTELLQDLVITKEDGTPLRIDREIVTATAEFLTSNLFRQWNSVLIQRHRNKLPVPMAVFDMMQKLFDTQMLKIVEPTSQTILSRLGLKHIKTLRLDFSTLMNQSRNLISVESQFAEESELAEAILKTTVQSRYDTKLLKIKGHHTSDWDDDVADFKGKYLANKDQIMALPAPDIEDCCRILIGSFLSDLQDPDFLEILKVNKMEFLTTMTFTGIPIFAPVKDSSQINPWTLYIKNICVSPFEVISQTAMESSFAVGATNAQSEHREITLQADNPNSVFNVIVPIIPKEHCRVLKPLVRTNLFAVGATFCILKNALIVDHNCHVAALGCVWMRTIKDHPISTRPDYIKKRIVNIDETAKLYIDRKSYANYISALLTKPKQALMTEAPEEHEGSTLRCESMIKATFMLHLAKDKFASQGCQVTLNEMLQMVLIEFLGRCLTSNSSTTPYMDYLLPNFSEEQRTTWVARITEETLGRVNLTGDSLLESCFIPEQLGQHVRGALREVFGQMEEQQDLFSLEPSPNMLRLVKLRNSGSAGHVGWEDLRAWAQEMAGTDEGAAGGVALLTQDQIDAAFSPEMICSYLHHALENRQSRERFSTPVLGPQEAREAIVKRLRTEQRHHLKTNLNTMVEETALQKWKESYMKVHKELAVPLTRQQIIQQAAARGVAVTEQNFNQMYKYRAGVRLCRNCCQVESCPHYLKPDRRFNCHLEVERKEPDYPHTLHLVVSQHNRSTDEALQLIQRGSETGTNNRPKPSLLPDSAEDAIKLYVTELHRKYGDVEP